MINLSVALFVLSLLAIFRAPAKPLWFAAIGVTEWGHYMGLVSILLALISWRVTRRWGMSPWFCLASAVLYFSPLARASLLAQDLPSQFSASFGTPMLSENPSAPFRVSPLNLKELFLGVRSPAIRLSHEAYATIEGQTLSLDLYQPAQRGTLLPGVIVIHSGSWQSGERGEFPNLNLYLAARGYIVASIDYRMAPGAVFPAQRNDVYSAIAYLKNHADSIGLDKNRLILLGRSAGGQIALSAAYEAKDPAIKGVIAFYAPNDLVWGYSRPGNPLIMNSQKVIETYLGGKPADVPGRYETASPLHFVDKHTPPTLMIHGVRDELVWAQHDERLSKRLTEEGRPYFYLRLPWATHGCDANFSGPCGQLSTYTIERFLAAVTQKESHG